MLQRHEMSWAQPFIEANFILQQDNDQKDTSNWHNIFLEKKQAAGILSIMEFLAHSPDLLWSSLNI